jgi:hypothetical protein
MVLHKEMKMKRIVSIMSITTLLIGCSTSGLVTKPWHVSPSRDPRMSVVYPHVEWSVIEKLSAGMPASEAKVLVHNLQSYHHPVNAIVFSTYGGHDYEVALKLSKDKTAIDDISYKAIGGSAEQSHSTDAPEVRR